MRESSQIAAAVRDNSRPVEKLVTPDDGHGFARPIDTIALVTTMEGFFAQHLGGRERHDVPADVAAQPKVPTVDPRTVDSSAHLTGAKP